MKKKSFKIDIYPQFIAAATERISRIWTSSLVIMDCDFLINPILHQRIHDCAVHLPKEPPCLSNVFG